MLHLGHVYFANCVRQLKVERSTDYARLVILNKMNNTLYCSTHVHCTNALLRAVFITHISNNTQAYGHVDGRGHNVVGVAISKWA